VLRRRQVALPQILFAQSIPAGGGERVVPGPLGAFDSLPQKRAGLGHAILPRPQGPELDLNFGKVIFAIGGT